MRIKYDQIFAHVRKNIAPLYTVFGDEHLLVNEATDLIRASAYQQGYTERKVFTVDNRFNWFDLKNASCSTSLFSDRQMLDIRIPSGKPGKEGGKAIEDYCRALATNVLTLITLPKIDKSGQVTKWFKALENTGVVIAVYPVERLQLPEWIKQRLGKQQQITDADTLQFLTDKVEGNLLAAYQEIQKLALCYPTGLLSFNQVKDVVLDVARYDVFKLSEAMLAADIARYARILDELRGEGIAAPIIITTLANKIRSVIIICKGLHAGKPLIELMRDVRVWGLQQKIMADVAKRTNFKQLVQALLHVAKIDRISKGVASGDVWDELLHLGNRFVRVK